MAPAEGQGFEVFLKYLPASADEGGVRALFQSCGEIVGDVRLLRDSSSGRCKGVGWLTFAAHGGAKAAVAKDGVQYDGRHVQVSMAKQVTWSGGHAASVGGIAGTIQEGGTHTPAMAKEVVAAIVGGDREGVYVDGTFGRGGHSRLILASLGKQGALHAFDLDPEAVKVGRALQKEDRRFRIHHGGFKTMASALAGAGVEPEGVNGIFLDLGISSPQLDEAARGFRPEQSGPLDLRFDLTRGQAASEFLRDAPREELIRVLREYGDPSDPHAARRVADAVCLARAPGGRGAPTTTKEFSDLVASCRGYEYQAMHAAKATFQALRIHLNDEFGQLRGGMAAALELLAPGGRLGVLTWKHSECALIVDYLRKVELAPPDFPLLRWHKQAEAAGGAAKAPKRWGFAADAAQRPSAEELRVNSRSRSAVLHVLRKRRGVLCSDLEALAAAAHGWAEGGGSSSSTAGAPAEAEAGRRKKRRGSCDDGANEEPALIAAEAAPEGDDGAAKRRKKAKQSQKEANGAGVDILFEDADILAINKPAGMLCHPSPGYWDHGTVTHALASRLPAEMLEHRESYTGEADSFIPRAVVHRLDKGTTGALLLAKTPRAEEGLASQFKGRSMKKRYVALLVGSHPGGEAGTTRIRVDQPIARDPDRPGKVRISPEGKAAKSVVHVHAHSPEHGLSLVTVDLLTGRQHQIRVHCAHLGAPVAGDADYGGAPSGLARALGSAPRRPLLHCWSMQLAHPATEEPLAVEAPLPPDLRDAVAHVWPELSSDPAAWPAQSAPAAGAAAGAWLVRLRGLPFVCAAAEVVDFLAPAIAIGAEQVKVGNKNKKRKTLKPGDVRPGEAEVVVRAAEGVADKIRELNNQHLGGRYIEVIVERRSGGAGDGAEDDE